MSAAAGNIEARVGLKGVAAVRSALLALGSGAKRLQGQMSGTAGAIRSDFSRILSSGINPATVGIQGLQNVVAGLSFASAIGGAIALHQTIKGIVQSTVDMEAEINRLAIDAQAWGITGDGKNNQNGAAMLSALESMYGAATGRDQGDAIQDFMNRIIEVAEAANEGDEKAQKSLEKLNLNPMTFFRAGTDELKQLPDMIMAISDAMVNLDEERRRSGWSDILGKKQAANGLRLFGMSRRDMQDYIEEHGRLRNLTDEDIAWASRLNYSRDRMGAANRGFATALGSGYASAYTDLLDQRREFMAGLFDDARAIGGVFGEFSNRVSDRLQTFSTKILQSLKGTGDSIATGPLPGALDKVADLIGWTFTRVEELVDLISTGTTDVGWLKVVKSAFDALRDGAGWARERTAELLAYLETGSTDVGWINNLVIGFNLVSDSITWTFDRIKEMSDYLETGSSDIAWVNSIVSAFDTIRGVVTEVGDAVFWLAEKFGIDSFGEKTALVIGLILFRGTIFSLIGLVAKLTSGLVIMAGKAALVGTASAAIGVAGAAIGSATDVAKNGGGGKALGRLGGLAAVGGAAFFGGKWAAEKIEVNRMLSNALEDSETISEEKGQAAGAAYMKAYLDYVKARFGEGKVEAFMNKKLAEDYSIGGSYDLKDFEAQINAKINISNAQEAAEGARLAFEKMDRIPLDRLVDIGGGITIPRVELQSETMNRLYNALEGIPATIRIDSVDLGAAANLTFSGASAPAPFRQASEVSPSQQLTSEINLNVGGQQMAPIRTTPDYARQFEQSAAAANRSRM